METIYYNIDYDLNIEKYFDDGQVCFLDIETTGFSRVKDIIYLVGLLIYNEGKYTLKQYFLNSPEKEKLLLKSLIHDIEESKYIVTFNGNTFDIPFLNSKYRKYDIKYNIPKNKNMDLYRIIRDNKELFPLQNFKLKSIEKYIGINREDTLSGKDCISLYYSYINKRQKEKRKLILKHNYDDLYYLPFILKALDIIDENKTIRILHSPFEDEINIKIENISFINDMMKLYCKTDPLKIDSYIDYGGFYNLDWNTDEGILNMEFQVKEGLLSTREKSFYLDLKGYENKIDVIDSTSFNLPSNIILLKIGNSLVLDNIKNIVRSTIKNIIK